MHYYNINNRTPFSVGAVEACLGLSLFWPGGKSWFLLRSFGDGQNNGNIKALENKLYLLICSLEPRFNEKEKQLQNNIWSENSEALLISVGPFKAQDIWNWISWSIKQHFLFFVKDLFLFSIQSLTLTADIKMES